MRRIENLNWKPKWVTQLGCLQGCLDYLDAGVSDAWLFGACGHAFIINIHEEICPSGPTAWNTEGMLVLSKNVGCNLDIVMGHKSQSDFREKQEVAWEKVRNALNKDIPCYGWELDIPEFYVIYGYDDTGYYFRGPGCDSGKGPLPWRKLGDTGIGVIEMVIVMSGKASPAEQTVKEALDFALEHSHGPKKWIFPEYRAGLAGYDVWIRALRDNKAGAFGMAFNAAVWAECRHHAVEFLREAREKLDEDLASAIDEATTHYSEVSRQLHVVAEAFPFLNVSDEQREAHMADQDRRKAATEALEVARREEEKGLKALEQIACML